MCLSFLLFLQVMPYVRNARKCLSDCFDEGTPEIARYVCDRECFRQNTGPPNGASIWLDTFVMLVSPVVVWCGVMWCDIDILKNISILHHVMQIDKTLRSAFLISSRLSSALSETVVNALPQGLCCNGVPVQLSAGQCKWFSARDVLHVSPRSMWLAERPLFEDRAGVM